LALALRPQNFLLLHLFYTSADRSASTSKKISEKKQKNLKNKNNGKSVPLPMEKYPASWMILSHFMWTMWFVGVWTSGMYDPLSFQLRRRIFGWLLEWLSSALDAEDELPRKPP
jgi:hypothetical protein